MSTLTAALPATSTSSPTISTGDTPLARDFRRDGFAGPFRAVAEADVPRVRRAYLDAAGIDDQTWGPAANRPSAFHHRQRWAYDLATSPAILDRIEEILGPDIVLWAMYSWYKPPLTGKRIPWHQDASYWPMEPVINVTAWMALDHCDRSNGGLRVIPGTHHQRWEHPEIKDPTSEFGKGIDGLDDSKALDLTFQPGEFVLFNENTLHGSERNLSPRPRLALSLRYTTPAVRLHGDKWGDDRVRAFQVRGVDRFGFNDQWRMDPPA